LTISRLDVEARMLSALQDKLLRKDFFEEFCREFAKPRLDYRRLSFANHSLFGTSPISRFGWRWP
jgi:hypothetical protein